MRLAILLAIALLPTTAFARDQIRIVGSSTVFPFVAAAAKEFSDANPKFRTPIVESTGTGGGLKMFCEGVGDESPDFANASRPIKTSEVELCAKNGVKEIVELEIGFDGIVIANAIASPALDISKQELFLALAKQVPGKDGKLVVNPYKKWNEVAAHLPDMKIEVYGPPPTSGTRDAFVELVMEEGCKGLPAYEVAYPDAEARKNACKTMREDGHFVEAGENDNIIVQKLAGNPEAIGLFGYSFLEQNASSVKGNKVGGKEPSFENIHSGAYGIARSLFVYAKKAHVGKVPGIQEFAVHLVSDASAGEDGTLTLKGLIPLPADRHEAVKKVAADLTVMGPAKAH